MANRWIVGVALMPLVLHANPVHRSFEKLPSAKQAQVLQRMMEREGYRCGEVEAPFFQGFSSDGSAFWSFTCKPGGQWRVMFGGATGENVALMTCKQAAALRSPCFVKFRS